MSLANALNWVLSVLVLSLVASHLTGSRRRFDEPDGPTQRRRARVAWEVRALVIGAAGPFAAGIYVRYLSTDYTLPLLLFITAGFLTAGRIAPRDQRVHR